jgi:hypothetical protein
MKPIPRHPSRSPIPDRLATTTALASIPRLCGSADQFGRCREKFHSAACSHNTEGTGALSTPEGMQAWRTVLQRRAALPLADSNGRGWRTHWGEIATLGDHAEALTGVRRRTEGLFEHGPATPGNPRPETTATIQRQPGFSRGTQATAQALAAQAGLATSADSTRQRRAWQDEHQRRVADRAVRTRAPSHPDLGESMRERRERMRQPVQLSNAHHDHELLHGELPVFTYGQL